MQGLLGSIDANTGDLLLGWDTDQFPTDIYLTTKIMLAISQVRRHHSRRRELRCQGAARELRADRPVPRPRRRHGRVCPRPEDCRRDPGRRRTGATSSRIVTARGTAASVQEIEAGKHNFQSLEAYMLEKGDAAPNESGRQEMLENLINRYL